MAYEVTEKIARIPLDRPARGDPAVHVMALSGNGTGFCGGYDLVETPAGAPRVCGPT
jgi:enoyl-CoA hydratase